jgi:pimeloyl-ACP methyl ester carboxylesterase
VTVTGPAATSRDEVRALIPCGDAELSAILTRPTVPANGVALVLYAGRWSVTSIGRSRIWVHLARRLAGHGYHSLRLDFLGLGESTGKEREIKLSDPFTEEPAAATRWLAEQGLTDLVLMGTCYGARVALAGIDGVEHLRGIVLFAPPIRDFVKGEQTATLPTSEFVKRALSKRVLSGLRDANKRKRYAHHARRKLARLLGRRRGGAAGRAQERFDWASPGFLEPFERLVRRRVPVLLFYGEEDGYYDEFRKARSGRLGRLLDEAGDLVTLVVVPGRFYGLGEAEVQRLSLEAVEAWLPRIGLPAGPAVPAAAYAEPG